MKSVLLLGAVLLGSLGGGGTPGGSVQDPVQRDAVRALVAEGKMEAALKKAQEIERTDPAAVWQALRYDARAWLPQGGAWLRAGRDADAIWVFQVLADGEPGPGWVPGEAWALANLALTQRHLGWVDAAEKTYRLGLAAAPLDPLVWNDWGLFLRGQGRLQDARAAFEQSVAVDQDPAVGPALTNLVQLAAMHPAVLPRPPMDLLREGLSRRPNGRMLRRLAIEWLAAERVEAGGTAAGGPAPGGGTDSTDR